MDVKNVEELDFNISIICHAANAMIMQDIARSAAELDGILKRTRIVTNVDTNITIDLKKKIFIFIFYIFHSSNFRNEIKYFQFIFCFILQTIFFKNVYF